MIVVLLCLVFQLNQITGLYLVSYMLSHPDVVPAWLNLLEVSRIGLPQSGESICDHASQRQKRDIGSMMDGMPMMNLSMMRGPMMHGHGPMMHDHRMPGPMMESPKVSPSGSEAAEGKQAGVDDSSRLPRVDDLMLPGQMMPDVGNKIPAAIDSVGVQLADVLSDPDHKVSVSHSAAAADDDYRDLIIPIHSETSDSHYFSNNIKFLSKRREIGLNAGECHF